MTFYIVLGLFVSFWGAIAAHQFKHIDWTKGE